jgi:hypothetical protein
MAETVERQVFFTVISFNIFVAISISIQVFFFLLLYASGMGLAREARP